MGGRNACSLPRCIFPNNLEQCDCSASGKAEASSKDRHETAPPPTSTSCNTKHGQVCTLFIPSHCSSRNSIQYKERATKLTSSLGTLLTEKTRSRAEALRRLPEVSGIAWDFTNDSHRKSNIGVNGVCFSNWHSLRRRERSVAPVKRVTFTGHKRSVHLLVVGCRSLHVFLNNSACEGQSRPAVLHSQR